MEGNELKLSGSSPEAEGLFREMSETILLLLAAGFTLAGYLALALAFVGVAR